MSSRFVTETNYGNCFLQKQLRTNLFCIFIESNSPPIQEIDYTIWLSESLKGFILYVYHRNTQYYINLFWLFNRLGMLTLGLQNNVNEEVICAIRILQRVHALKLQCVISEIWLRLIWTICQLLYYLLCQRLITHYLHDDTFSEYDSLDHLLWFLSPQFFCDISVVIYIMYTYEYIRDYYAAKLINNLKNLCL